MDDNAVLANYYESTEEGLDSDDIEDINLAHREIHNGNIIHLINKPISLLNIAVESRIQYKIT